MLENHDDINKITDYFSYEHFYVIYNKFWDLDADHDTLLTREDMRKHAGGALTDRIIERIFSPVVNLSPIDGTIDFEHFAMFLMAEEDKRHPRRFGAWRIHVLFLALNTGFGAWISMATAKFLCTKWNTFTKTWNASYCR